MDRLKKPFPHSLRAGRRGLGKPPKLTDEMDIIKISIKIRENPEWDVKMNDPKIVAKWKEEIANQFEYVEEKFDFVLKELGYYLSLRDGPVEVAAVDGTWQSDSLIDDTLREKFISGVRVLEDVPDKYKDWHPRTNEQVLNLVNPSMYCFVHGKSKVLKKPLDFKGLSDQETRLFHLLSSPSIKKYLRPNAAKSCFFEHTVMFHRSTRSLDHQWLPCEMEWNENGSIEIASYINNLHPDKHTGLYDTIQKIFEKFIPLFNKVLTDLRNPRPNRLGNFVEPAPRNRKGPFSIFKFIKKRTPNKAKRLDDESDTDLDSDDSDHKSDADLDSDESDAKNDADLDSDESDDKRNTDSDSDGSDDKGDTNLDSDESDHKRNTDSDSDESDDKGDTNLDSDESDHKSYIDLDSDESDDEGEIPKFSPPKKPARVVHLNGKPLQVIVTLVNIVLTPEKPTYPGGGWHLEGMANERIVGTGIYYYSSENITESRLHFRQAIREPDESDAQEVYDFYNIDHRSSMNQELGSIVSKEGRCIAFPNTLQHRVGSFQLEDPTLPGHRKILVFFLIDPTVKVISTARVPPQQKSWYINEITKEFPALFPEEIAETIANMIQTDFSLMTHDEAKEVRDELMNERKFFTKHNNQGHFERKFSLRSPSPVMRRYPNLGRGCCN